MHLKLRSSTVTAAMALRVSFAQLLLLAFASTFSSALANVVVTGNPHMPPSSATNECQRLASAAPAVCSTALFISPDRVLSAPARLQADTFSHLQHVRYLDSVVPVSAAPINFPSTPNPTPLLLLMHACQVPLSTA